MLSKAALGIIVLVVVLFSTFAGMNSLQKVEAGHRGVKVFMGQIDNTKSYEPGPYWLIPWFEEMVNIETRIQKYEAKTTASSNDLQVVSSIIAVNFKPDPNTVHKLYDELGLSYVTRIIDPAVSETLKQVTAKYQAVDLIQKRELVKQEINDSIKLRLGIHNLLVETISITDFDFSAQFNEAIENKVTAVENAMAEENKVAIQQAIALQKIAEAEGIKQSKIEIATGEAEAIRLKAEAEAGRLHLLADALAQNPNLLTLEQIRAWNGIFPSTFFSGEGDLGTLLQIPINSPQTSQPEN